MSSNTMNTSLSAKNVRGAAIEVLDKLTNLIHPGPREFMRALPDSLFLGTALFALLTQSFPLGILTFAMMEVGILDWCLAGVLGSIQNNKTPVNSDICLSGIPSPYQISILGHVYPQVEFPSTPILFIASTLFYTLAGILNFREELKELALKEPEWAARIPLSIVFTTLLLLFYVTWRVVYSCDSTLGALGSVVLGAIFGGVIHLLHVYLFGRNSINFLGLPLLADRAADGTPLYVCAKQE